MQAKNNRIKLIKELGRGAFGVTFLGYDPVKNKNVAVKTINIERSKQLGADINSINEEIDTLKRLSAEPLCHKYIACYYNSYRSQLNRIDTAFIISEYIDGISVTSFIKKYDGNILPNGLWPLCYQLLLGLEFIHNKGYAHRDIKPDNILITKNYTIKYIDFGLACINKCKIFNCKNTCKGNVGTILYMPPESFNDNSEDSLLGAQAHDIWSLGLVLYQMLNGINSYPFPILNNSRTKVLSDNEIRRNISLAPTIRSNYKHDDGRSNKFVQSMLINNWKNRPTINGCISLMTDLILTVVYLS